MGIDNQFQRFYYRALHNRVTPTADRYVAEVRHEFEWVPTVEDATVDDLD